MFQELDAVTLTAPIIRERTWDLPEDSPLFDPAGTGEGLLPGDVGVIVYVQGDREAFEVEFLERNSGYTVAIATVFPYQMRLATDADRASYRFREMAAVR